MTYEQAWKELRGSIYAEVAYAPCHESARRIVERMDKLAPQVEEPSPTPPAAPNLNRLWELSLHCMRDKHNLSRLKEISRDCAVPGGEQQDCDVLTETLGSLEAAIRENTEALASQGMPQPVKEPPASPGEGYRWVRVGEMLQRGDQHPSRRRGWVDTGMDGFLAEEDCLYRRKITPPDPGEGYRWVEKGEVLQKGDEYAGMVEGEWAETGGVGDRCVCPQTYRRKIEPRRPQVGDKVVIEGVVVEDDGSDVPYRVQTSSEGTCVWFEECEVKLVEELS